MPRAECECDMHRSGRSPRDATDPRKDARIDGQARCLPARFSQFRRPYGVTPNEEFRCAFFFLSLDRGPGARVRRTRRLQQERRFERATVRREHGDRLDEFGILERFRRNRRRFDEQRHDQRRLDEWRGNERRGNERRGDGRRFGDVAEHRRLGPDVERFVGHGHAAHFDGQLGQHALTEPLRQPVPAGR